MSVNLPLVSLLNAVYGVFVGGVVTVTVEPAAGATPAVTQTATINPRGRKRRPYILLRVETVEDESTLDEVAHGAMVVFDIFTGPLTYQDTTYQGSALCSLYAQAVTTALMGAGFDVSGFKVYSPERELVEQIDEGAEEAGDGDWHGILRFSYLVDQR